MKDFFYVVMTQTEDGLYIGQMTREELTKRLNEKYWGNKSINSLVPKFCDGQFDVEGITILECVRVVLPREVKTVTAYEV